jgi:nickel superoxide dismutase
MRFTDLLAAANPFAAITPVDAHCDLFCGVYYPEQARIEAESVKACSDKYAGSDDEVFRARCLAIKEERAELVKHHLWVLWTDYFKPPHLEEYPELHDMFWQATKLAGDAKKTMDPAVGQALLDAIDAISVIFWATKGGKPAWLSA